MTGYWYVPNERGPVGPVSINFLRKFLSEHTKWWDVPVWKDGFDDWMKAGDIVELQPAPFKLVSQHEPPPYKSENRSLLGITTRRKTQRTKQNCKESDGQVIRWFARIGLGLFASIFILLGAGARRTPHVADQIFGITVYLIGILIIFVVFFCWKRTKLRGGTRPRVIKGLAIIYLIWGIILLVAMATITLSTIVGSNANSGLAWLALNAIGKVIGPIVSLLIVLEGIALVVIGGGILNAAVWARTAAIVLAFPLAFGWPYGFIVALWTWWEFPLFEDRQA